MQIVIYISCNIKVGQGHLSRCLNLAHMLKGNNISFTGNIDLLLIIVAINSMLFTIE